MKKILLTLVLLILFIPGVKADTEIDIIPQDIYSLGAIDKCSNHIDYYYYSNFEEFISDNENKEIFDTLYNNLKKSYFENLQSSYPYYTLSVSIISSSSSEFILEDLSLIMYLYDENKNYYNNYSITYHDDTYFSPGTYNFIACNNTYFGYVKNLSFNYNSRLYLPLALFESNIDLIMPTYEGQTIKFNIYDKNSNLLSTYSSGDNFPIYLDNTYEDYLSNSYTEVNLDNYEYVILSLKDYSKGDAFDTNLQVKGMIGITPVYEFGTIEKENITDRCNVSYSDYTDYRLYILKNDLINNAVYYVKGCQNGSLFKFNSTIFDITYITADNVNDPVVTIGGQEYKTIPFSKLTNSANQNEENNFIPGSNEQFNPVGGITEYISNFWNGLVTFMGLVTKFFNTLPIEIRAISITAFSTGLTLGIIKFIKS